MPLGFANNIFTASSTTAGADWANWDGTNDSTITVTSITTGSNYGRWIGFCDFNDDYGLVFATHNKSGASNDDIVYAKLQNSDDTLTYSGQAVHLTTSGTTFSSEHGSIVKTNGGNIFANIGDLGDGARIYSISGSTVTQHTNFDSSSTESSKNCQFFRQPSSNVYVNLQNQAIGELVTLTDNGNSSSDSTGTETGLANPSSDWFFSKNYIIPGFVDEDTPIRLKSPTADNGDDGLPVKMDLTSTGSGQTPGTFAGLSAQTFNLNASTTNALEFYRNATSPFPTTDFNDRMLFIERDNTVDKLRMTNYKAGDTSYSQATLTDSDIPISDTSVQGIFVGSNNTIFLFTIMDIPNDKIWIFRYNTSTNVLEKVLSIDHGEDFDQERVKLCRWGNDRAVLMYNDNKIRLLVP